MKNARGVSLVELLVATAIGIAISVLAGALFTDTLRDFTRNQSLSGLVGAAPAARKSLHRFFERAIGAEFTDNSGGVLQSGYKIFGKGGIYLVSDLRDCPAFNPGTSNIAANQTEIFLLCCDKNQAMSLNAPSPPLSAGAVPVTSACTKGPGLSIEQKQGGTTIRKTCISDIVQMDVLTLGVHATKLTPYYQLDFFGNTGKNSKGDFIPKYNFRYGQYEAVGNLNPLTVICQ